ncbi:AraC family transcriptional regulator [Pontibacter sp. BT310]|uniref:Helix-turn-helix domain-containing protein n=1 Tax=Pontibacter populi TaxID=890055 RepID=A0ABS6XCB2_9BACT|nr:MULTISPECIES: helix-turn-helix domain-containing protein [Pontibacter]MBJ6117967.1 AraC family transcriptional regulator [Pontibacter sp. BT310]MBR0570394.1 AraC family transcriptional regulator [Microvirga sp. STS03]MBW3364820.1 helix-turn-helix domain-containing protein [Pontibacter populi]
MDTDQEIEVQLKSSADFQQPYQTPFYQILLFKGKGSFIVDFTEYTFSGNTILFLTPYQCFQWNSPATIEMECLRFHGDFYCIEYHKKEVACNGLLFNNIYLAPHITISDSIYSEISALLLKIEDEKQVGSNFSSAILKAYLQLILALCSKEKSIYLNNGALNGSSLPELVHFQELLEQNFIQERSPAFYASKTHLTPNAFGKNIKKQFGKTPTQLIQERVILEAKKLLHLTHKSVKEIAAELNFEDEFYFSRYFKKSVGLSPLHYREDVGISIVAK